MESSPLTTRKEVPGGLGGVEVVKHEGFGVLGLELEMGDEVLTQGFVAVLAAGQTVGGVQLHAVAGAEHHAFLEARKSAHLLDRMRHLRFGKGEALTHLDGRGFVVQAHTDEAAAVVRRLRHA
jgi:hypothetical protein